MTEKISLLEKHLQTGIATLATIAFVWMANTTSTSNTKIEVLTVKVEALQKIMDVQSSDRYYGRDAAQDFKIRDAAFDRLELRVRALEIKK